MVTAISMWVMTISFISLFCSATVHYISKGDAMMTAIVSPFAAISILLLVVYVLDKLWWV